MSSRTAHIQRKTSETDIDLNLNLTGTGESHIDTGIGFFDHMLTALARHGLFDLTVTCKGDLEVDAHHTVEDIGICLGLALSDALGDKAGIARFGSAYVPMDEALARAVVDLSGRAHLIYNAAFAEERIGAFPTALGLEFFTALAHNARLKPAHRPHPRQQRAPRHGSHLQSRRPIPATSRCPRQSDQRHTLNQRKPVNTTNDQRPLHSKAK